MNNKITADKLFILLAIMIFLGAGCAGDKGKQTSEASLSTEFNGVDNDLTEKINTAKKIFYSLPSPLETAILIKNAGATYDADLLNPIDNSSRYTSNLKMALNLGIYTTDLSYASLFEQNQATLNYINAAKKMADGLDILDAIDEQTITRLQDNINNRDVIIDIISETLLNSGSFLEDKGLQATSSIMLVGGWVEGLHIATNLVPAGTNLREDKLVERIVDQKLSLDIVLNLLNNSKDNPDIQAIMKDVNDLKEIYDRITIENSEITVVEDPETNITTLKSKSNVRISKDIFNDLKTKVQEIRSRYIS